MEEETPPEFVCPITKDTMLDPVCTQDGHTYEREAIEEWFAMGRKTSPITGLPLRSTELAPNFTLKNAIETYKKDRPRMEAAERQVQDLRACLQECERKLRKANARTAAAVPNAEYERLVKRRRLVADALAPDASSSSQSSTDDLVNAHRSALQRQAETAEKAAAQAAADKAQVAEEIRACERSAQESETAAEREELRVSVQRDQMASFGRILAEKERERDAVGEQVLTQAEQLGLDGPAMLVAIRGSPTAAWNGPLCTAYADLHCECVALADERSEALESVLAAERAGVELRITAHGMQAQVRCLWSQLQKLETQKQTAELEAKAAAQALHSLVASDVKAIASWSERVSLKPSAENLQKLAEVQEKCRALTRGCRRDAVAKLKGEGRTATDLKHAGFSAAELGEGAYTACELREAGFTVGQLKQGGFSLRQVKDAGFEVSQLKEGLYSASELKEVGCALKELMEVGFSAEELKEAGFAANQLKEVGFTPNQLREGKFTACQLKDADFSAQELKDGGFTASELMELGLTLSQLAEVGFSAAQLREAGFAAGQLLEAGLTPTQLKGGGFTAGQLKEAGLAAGPLKDAGFAVGQLKEGGFQARELQEVGFSLRQLKLGGFPARDLMEVGATASELKSGGFTARELKDSGFGLQELKDGGFSALELKNSGFDACELKASGFDGRQLKDSGFEAAEMEDAFTAAECESLGYSARDMFPMCSPLEGNLVQGLRIVTRQGFAKLEAKNGDSRAPWYAGLLWPRDAGKSDAEVRAVARAVEWDDTTRIERMFSDFFSGFLD